MYKYWEIAKVYMKTQLIWRADVVFNMIFTITKIIFAYMLWNIIFEGRSTIAGFTFYGMMSYYIISSFLSQLEMSQGVSEEINQRIRNGTFSKYMVIPVSIEGYFVAMEAGLILFYFIFDFLAGAIWIVIFQIQFIFTTSVFAMVCAILMIIIGSIVPLALFPDVIVQIMKLLPFYYITYLPSMLLVGYCEEQALSGLVIISIWSVVLQAIIKYTWKNYVRKYDGVGI